MVSGYTGINVPVEEEVNMEIRPNDLGYLTSQSLFNKVIIPATLFVNPLATTS